jgi:hypothetical protein
MSTLCAEHEVMATGLLGRTFQTLLSVGSQLQTTVRNGHYVNWAMIRDVKRRKLVKEQNVYRNRYNAIRKNTILPKELQVGKVGK